VLKYLIICSNVRHLNYIIPQTDEPDYSTPVAGFDNFIKYEITGGKLLSITADKDENENIIPSLIISIDAIHDGSLVLTIPRSVFDVTTNDEFIILIDGETISFDEYISPTDRTLTIPFPAEAKEIKIIGLVPSTIGTLADTEFLSKSGVFSW